MNRLSLVVYFLRSQNCTEPDRVTSFKSDLKEVKRVREFIRGNPNKSILFKIDGQSFLGSGTQIG